MGSTALAALALDEVAARMFIDIAVIIVVARSMGALFKRLGQPAVVGEIVGGILLGPTLLGAFPGNLDEHLFPLEVRPFLKVTAQLGLIIFMFIVGLELDTALIRGKERLAAAISGFSVALPFALGFGLAAVIHDRHSIVDGEAVDFVPFALFIGAAMSVTAFPVLARILSDRGMQRTEIGALVLACAAVDDILAWSLLAVVLAVVASTSLVDLPVILVESLVFVGVMFKVVRPQLERLARHHREVGRLTPNMLGVVLVGILVSSFITSEIGIHSIFGAFVFGVVMPREDAAALLHEILERLEQIVVLLLLPVFFVVTGLDVDVRGLGLSGLWQLGLILLVACVGKFVGATTAGRLQGLRLRKASTVGILMNTRGLTELVILNVGLAFGVLDRQLFTMLVIMALFTTIIAGPLLRVVYPDKLVERDVAEAELLASGATPAYRVVAAFDDPEADGRPLVDIALAIVDDERPAEIILTRFLPAKPVEVGAGLSLGLVEMADTLDALKNLARGIEERGIAAVIRSQFTDDIAREVRAHGSAIGVDVVVLGGTAPEGVIAAVRPLFADPPCTIVVVPAPATVRITDAQAIRVRVSGSDDSMAAAEVGTRLADATGATLEVAATGGGRADRAAASIVGHIARGGVPARVGASDGSGAVSTFDSSAVEVAPADGRELDGAGAALIVRARAGGGGDDALRKLAERLAQRVARAADPKLDSVLAGQEERD